MTDPALLDLKYVPQFGQDTVGLVINVGGVATEPDGNAVAAVCTSRAGDVVFTRPASHIATGQYGVSFDSNETAVPGIYSVTFSYRLGGVLETYAIGVEVGATAPDYDALPFEGRSIVESVWIRFADLFDSPAGGPHLQTYVQTHFGRNRMAQLLRIAVGRLNTISQPHMTYSVTDPARPFPVAQWGALLEQALYVEVVKHLIRSYTEIPDVVLGTSVSRLDRASYQQRWATILTMEQDDLRSMLDNFKMANMGLGNASVLVSGGVYGRGNGLTFPGPGAAAARGYFAVRYY